MSLSYPPPTTAATGIPRPTHVSITSASRRIKPSSDNSNPPRSSAACTSTPASYNTSCGLHSSIDSLNAASVVLMYTSSPVPVGNGTSRELLALVRGKLSSQCTDRV